MIHRFCILLLCGLAATFARADGTSSVTHQLFQVQSSVLENGLHVIRLHRNISDTFTAQLVVDVGLQDFPCEEQQLPHLLEHLLFEGTKRFDRQQLRQRIRDHGGQHNAYTTEEYTHFTLDIHSSYPEIALENLYSMLAEPLFQPEHLASSKSVIHAELGTSSNRLQLAMSRKKDLHKMATARVFAGSHLDCPDLTTPDGIDMARIKAVFARHYVPANMTLILLGHFDDARTDQALQETLARLPARSAPKRDAVQFAPLDPAPLMAPKSLFDPEVDLALYLRTPGSTHPDYPAFELAAEYLGEQLFYQVRGEKGLGYTPHAYVESNSQFGFLRAATKTTDQWHDEVANLFRQQYQLLRTQGIPAADVERLKRKLVLEFESKQRDNAELAQTYRHFRQQIREQGAMPDLIERLQDMPPEQVNTALQRQLPEQALIASARPPSLFEALLQVLPFALAAGALCVWLLRWNRRRLGKKSS